MLRNVYALFDDKANLFTDPFPAVNEDFAIRMFADVVAKTPIMRTNPQDFTLYCIGTFDDSTGYLSHDMRPAYEATEIVALLDSKEST
jgi:hypothetical protein